MDIVLLADEFERKFAGLNWNESSLDYLEEIDKFSEERLLEKYGAQEKVVDEAIEKESDNDKNVDVLIANAANRSEANKENDIVDNDFIK